MRLQRVFIVSILALSERVLSKVKQIGSVRAATGPDLPAQYCELPIDHNNTSAGTFKNRWWFNDTFYQPGGPVILFDGGEANAEGLLDYLSEREGVKTSVMQLAQKYHGIGLLWEHRYYGKSVPFIPDAVDDTSNLGDIASNFTSTQWSFLTIDQALEDVVVFANNFSLPSNASAAGRIQGSEGLHPSKTPWIFVGGSYPGVRAALMRVRNPEVIYASWASSAPVQGVVNGHGYYDQIERALPSNCSADVIAAVEYADDALSDLNSEKAKEVSDAVFHIIESETYEGAKNDTNVGSALQVPFQIFQGFGLRSVLPFCNNIESSFNRSAPSDAGIAVAQGGKAAFDNYVGAMGYWLNSTFGNLIRNQSEPLADAKTFAHLDGNAPLPVSNPLEVISWYYQVNSEFGAYQVANPDPKKSIISKFVTVEVRQKSVQSAYPNVNFPSEPAIDHLNKYGGWKMNPPRVFWSNGEHDPWASQGLASVEPDGPNRTATTTVPAADSAPADGSYYGTIYAGQVHAEDLFSSPNNTAGANAAFEEGLRMFTQALDVWLPAFKGTNGTATASAGGATPTNGDILSAPRWNLAAVVLLLATLVLVT